MKKIIINGICLIGDELISGKGLVFSDKIEGLLALDELPEDAELIDARGAYVLPGFIDIHVHGMGGYDTMDATKEALDTLSTEMVKHGVTSFLATTVTHELEKVKKAIDNVRMHRKGVQGAKCHGIHLEGPFINPLKKGAHDEKFILTPDADVFKDDADVIRLVTYAPELDPEGTMLEWSKATGIKLSLGHSNASYAQAMDAFKKGVHSVTHIFNAMTGLHHREPGVVGAAFNADVYTELIADDIHVNPVLYQTLFKQKGNKRLMLITDCMCAGGMPAGKYSLGTLNVVVDHEKATLEDGTLAGSILTLNHALKHFVKHSEEPLGSVMSMMGENQAELLDMKGIGQLKKGFYADIVLMNESFEVLQTYVNGEPKLRS
ncbi:MULTISPECIES: N-acetylglucosamine-6-phosphate deacetylase [unclassified Fusibacter]|uniref:N-acetylglucosamine-6-phosphate deacetylase n=1 Tax=unclassified Fusibacter TaxID=2624464 RepID=UPI0010130611|nr:MULTISPECIES: N-acetylglucosamine-6-phosphate deacetylase [unclassified Fusibacter]MCK8059381.1 N-acetylglucosamine-6-phosphate deacetylase [Fusibacter sp. A2]NPE21155.1 N-acetylglucosamine-6-phosphate deacetylase [Fusibacter sp. A1]RXV62423.1 N-acetylglucosamine-6-phosphate deacetylase [Fusibacter sp. A1]